MEYRSPLGYNFKLERSLSASNEEKKTTETPNKDESISLDTSGSRKFYDSDKRRNSGGNRNYSPGWQRHSGNWKSPNPRNYKQDEPVPIEQFFHPSMLENPWEELEKDLEAS